MIVRNGAATLPACLASVAGIADEMIVVDTGSTDASAAIARGFGARVVSIPWPNDFAAARNEYLRLARCAWVLSLDADEILGPVSRRAMHQNLAARPRAAFVFDIRNYYLSPRQPQLIVHGESLDDVLPGIGQSISRTVRLFPRVRGVEYSYPVHESLLPALKRCHLRLLRCPVPIHHMGHLNGDDMAAKAATYRELGVRKLKENPQYFLAHLELAKIRLRDGELAAAEQLLHDCLRLHPRCSRAYYYLAIIAVQRERLDTAAVYLQRARAITPTHADIRHLQRTIASRLAAGGEAR